MTPTFLLPLSDDQTWANLLEEVLPMVHEVDRDALRIWFRLYPLRLHQIMSEALDPEMAASNMLLRGDWRLEDQIDSSHSFLFAHPYWPQVKTAVLADKGDGLQPRERILAVSKRVAESMKIDQSLFVALVTIAFRTLGQVGAEAFAKGSGKPVNRPKRTPEQVVAERSKQADGGLFGFLNPAKKKVEIRYDESQPDARFEAIQNQIITAASTRDQRSHVAAHPRCLPGEGPIPIECRSGKCSQCWVGVLGGNENLKPISEWERNRLVMFGYLTPENTEERPCIRLACQTQVYGNATLVIPPWHAFIGKLERLQVDSMYEEEIGRH